MNFHVKLPAHSISKLATRALASAILIGAFSLLGVSTASALTLPNVPVVSSTSDLGAGVVAPKPTVVPLNGGANADVPLSKTGSGIAATLAGRTGGTVPTTVPGAVPATGVVACILDDCTNDKGNTVDGAVCATGASCAPETRADACVLSSCYQRAPACTTPGICVASDACALSSCTVGPTDSTIPTTPTDPTDPSTPTTPTTPTNAATTNASSPAGILASTGEGILAFTGANALPLLAAALVVAALGTVMILVRRRATI